MAESQRQVNQVPGSTRARKLLRDQAKPEGSQRPGSDLICERLQLGAGFANAERNNVVVRLGALGSRLRSFRHNVIHLELSVKDRDTAGQRVTLVCRIAGLNQLVSTSDNRTMSTALLDVRDQMTCQVDDAKTRREPRNNRSLRRRSLRRSARRGGQGAQSGRVEEIGGEQ
jgi:ribosome-associated translation inhibitor RaiA